MLDALKITSRMKAVPIGFPAIKPTLNDYTWDEINKISESDLWDLYGIEVGDIKTISVDFDGKSGDVDCFIIGINHNEKFEGKGATFQLGLQKGIKIAMSMSKFDSSSGWENSFIRNTTCQNFFNALPSDLQKVIKETTKYSNNVGQSSLASAITATKDKIFIPSLFEVVSQPASEQFGGYDINGFEQAYQKVYDYYLVDKSLPVYIRNDLRSYISWWTRSPFDTLSKYFFNIEFNSNKYIWQISYADDTRQFGFCPCFKV